MSDKGLGQFSAGEYQRRYRLTVDWLAENALDALLQYANSYANGGIRWLTGFAARHDTYLFWPKEGEPVLLTQLFNHVPDAQRQAIIDDVRWGGPHPAGTVLGLLRQRVGRGRVGLAGRVPHSDYLTFSEGLPEVTWPGVGKGFMGLRLRKSDEEIAMLRRGAAFTDAAMAALVEAVHLGASEHQLAAAVEAAYTADGGQHGIHFMSSTPMDAPESYVPAQTQTARALQSGDVIICELSAGVGGYAGQIHRPIALGQSPGPAYRRIYEVALEAYQNIVAVLRPGASVGDVLEAADSIAAAGLTVCDDLLHGYGMGYLPPIVRTRQTAHTAQPPKSFTFEENMAVVVQPNVYDTGSGAGLQVGNLLLVTADGVELLQQYPMEFKVCALPNR